MTGLTDGTHTAVVDRIEDGLAALIVDDEPVGETVIDPSRLPADARHADAVVTLAVSDGTITSVALDAEATDERAEDAQSRFDRLSQRPDDDE